MKTGSARASLLGSVLAIVATGACSHPTVCVATAHVGLQLEVVDSVTSVPPSNPATLVIAGTSVDTLPRPGDASFNGHSFTALIGAPGTYSLVVRVDGYKPWTANNVVVPRDACGDVSETVTIAAKVQPTSN